MTYGPVARGTTSKTIGVRILDTTSVVGAGKTGLVYNSTNLTAYYKRQLDTSATQIALATTTVGVWASGGFVEIDSAHMAGQYELGLPNAAIGSGDASTWVEVYIYDSGSALGIPQTVAHIPLWAVDPQDATRAGLTALPNANAGASGGLPTLSANLSLRSNVLAAGTAGAGSANTITLTSAAATDNLYKYCLVNIESGTGAGQSRLIINYVGSTKVATVQKNWATSPDNTSVFTVTPFAVPAVVHSGIAQSGGASTITLQSVASATDNIYNGLFITIFSGTGAFQSRTITGYVGSIKVATLDSAWAVQPDSTSVYEIAAFHSVSSGSVDVATFSGAAATEIDAIKAKTDTIGSVNTTFTTPVTDTSQNQTVYQDRDYLAVDGLALPYTTNVAIQSTDTITYNVKSSTTTPIFTTSGVYVDANHFNVPLTSAQLALITVPASPDVEAVITRNADTGTAQSGSATNIHLRVAAPSTDLTGQTVLIQSGTGAGQHSTITAYNTTTKDATTTWTTAPDATSVYVVYRKIEVVYAKLIVQPVVVA